jgi:hypothetical protein
MTSTGDTVSIEDTNVVTPQQNVQQRTNCSTLRVAVEYQQNDGLVIWKAVSLPLIDCVDISFNNCVLSEIMDSIKYCIIQSSLKMCNDDEMNSVEHYVERDQYTLYYYDESTTGSKGHKHHVMPNYESVKKYIDIAIQQAGDIESIDEITFIVEFPSTFRIEKPTNHTIQSSVRKDSDATPNPTDSYTTNVPSTNNTNQAYSAPIASSNHRPYATPSFHTPPTNTFRTPTIVPNDYNVRTMEEFLIEFPCGTVTDHKNFLKKEMIPLRGKLPWIIWYKQMVEHGIRHGIYIPPFESLEKHNTLGGWWIHLPRDIQAKKKNMSGHILSALLNGTTITSSPELTKIQGFSCGYSALFSIMRNIHPRLMTKVLTSSPPIYKSPESYQDYILRWHNFVCIELVCNRTWWPVDICKRLISNLPHHHSLWVMQHFNNALYVINPHEDQTIIPPQYTMDLMADTISEIIDSIPSNSNYNSNSNHNHYRSTVRNIEADNSDNGELLRNHTDIHDSDISEVVHSIHAKELQNPTNCAICNHTGHSTIDCHKFISFSLCNLQAKSHPELVAKIVQKYKHFPSNNNHRTSTVRHTTESDPIIPEYTDDDSQHDTTVRCIYASSKCDHDTNNASSDEDFNIDIEDHYLNDFNNEIQSIDYESPNWCNDGNNIHCCGEDLIDTIAPKCNVTEIVAQFDSGANTNITNQKSVLWNLQKLKTPKMISDAGQTKHIANHRGYLVLPRAGDGNYQAIHTYYTPSMNVTILSPTAICGQFNKIRAWNIYNNLIENTANAVFNDSQGSTIFTLRLSLHNGLQWTQPLIHPTEFQKIHKVPSHLAHAVCEIATQESDFIIDDNNIHIDSLVDYIDHTNTAVSAEDTDSVIHQLNIKAQYQLWHQRLGHLQPRIITDMHHHANGIPKLPSPSIVDNCPVCLSAKMRRANASTLESRVATQCFQGLSIDMAFVIQKSKNTNRFVDNLGLNGETCYVLINDHFSGMVFGKALVNKSPPLEWFNQFLARYNPDTQHKSVRFDQGGEVGRCKSVIRVFTNYGYNIELTGADSSHQNGSVERGHSTIGNMMRTLLEGASLSRKFWPYAFSHALFIMNRIIHDGKESPPITICTGQRLSLASLRTFGCRVYVRLPGNRSSRLDDHNNSGIFLGYSDTMKNIFWYDTKTHRVKLASHVRFDEGMTDSNDPPPNIRILQRHQQSIIPPDAEIEIDPIDLSIDQSPFRILDTLTIYNHCDLEQYGFDINECHIRRRAYISDITPNSSASRIRNIRKTYIGSFIVTINDTPIYDRNDAIDAFYKLRNENVTDSFTITLAPDKYIPVRDRREHLSLNIGQIRHITSVRLSRPPIDDMHDFSTIDDLSLRIHTINASTTSTTVPITPEEVDYNGKYTRTKLRKLPTWHLWYAAEKKQLDAMNQQQMYSAPCIAPPNSIILRQHWNYYTKPDGTRTARNCCDGSLRAAPELHDSAQTYASCIEQPCQRLFYSLSAASGYYVCKTDAVNAYANAHAPSIPTYVRIDDAYYDWYTDFHGQPPSRDMVLRVMHAIQGHPESGHLWESFINDILINKLLLKSTTHERSLYHGTYNGVPILLKRQVDDIAVAAPTIDVAQQLIAAIGQYVRLAGNSLLDSFNGIQVEQSQHYIRLYCTDYIDRLLAKHKWDSYSSTDHDASHVKEPLPASLIKQIDIDTGPPEHSPEAIRLQNQVGFKFRQLLGELIYAYVICRLDIGYVLTKLAQFSQCPSLVHYTCLKRIALYLRSTKDWGIIYWRPTKLESLPIGTVLPYSTIDPQLPTFPIHTNPTELLGYVDAAHATDLRTRRSVTGYVITLCGAAICYRSKLQSTVATSSTEAEFIAAVTAAKSIKYLRLVLADLGPKYAQDKPTTIYEDNAAAILMINSSKPTPRSRHIDIQHFAIQEWKLRGDIILSHLAGILNLADVLTKCLGWILHSRHIRRAMGHHPPAWLLPPWPNLKSSIKTLPPAP